MTAVLAWLRRRPRDRERSGKEALAGRLRRELPRYEAGLARAAEALEGATYEEIQAQQACRDAKAPHDLRAALTRYQLAQETRRLAGDAFDVVRRQVHLRAGTLAQLEHELAEPQ